MTFWIIILRPFSSDDKYGKARNIQVNNRLVSRHDNAWERYPEGVLDLIIQTYKHKSTLKLNKVDMYGI